MLLNVTNSPMAVTKDFYKVHFYRQRAPYDYTDKISGKQIRNVSLLTGCTLHYGPCANRSRPCATPNSAWGAAIWVPGTGVTMHPWIGRKIALTRALGDASKRFGLNKETRKAIWGAYLKLSPPPLDPMIKGYLRKMKRNQRRDNVGSVQGGTEAA